MQPESEVDEKHLLSDHFRNKLQRKLKEQGKQIANRPVVIHENKSGNLGIHPYSTALLANGSHNYITLNAERRFTPRVLLRLQGYPDDYRIVVPDSQVRKQAGNSVVIPKIEAVAKAMFNAVNKEPEYNPMQINLFNTKIVEQRIYAH